MITKDQNLDQSKMTDNENKPNTKSKNSNHNASLKENEENNGSETSKLSLDDSSIINIERQVSKLFEPLNLERIFY